MGRPTLPDKVCSYCKERKLKSEFYGKARAGTCKKCQTIKQDNRRQFLADYLRTHPCVDCGESDIVVLEFDHLGDKTCSLAKMVRNNVSNQRLLDEIAKCAVRCANCHRKKTAKDFGWRFKFTEA